MQTNGKKTKNKSAKSKKPESKIKGEQKGKSKGHTKKDKNGLVHLHFFFDLLCFSFFVFAMFHFFVFLPGEKTYAT
jgi:hypothetical protein